MSDDVQIALIIAVAVILVLVLFRKRLSAILFRANSEGVEAELKTGDPAASASRPGVSIRGAKMYGSDQEISVRHDDAEVADTVQAGRGQKISVDKAPPGE